MTFVRPAVESYSVFSLAAIPGAVMLEVIYFPGGSITQLALEPPKETWKITIILHKHNICHNLFYLRKASKLLYQLQKN